MFIAKQVNYEFDAEGIALRKLGKTLNLMTLPFRGRGFRGFYNFVIFIVQVYPPTPPTDDDVNVSCMVLDAV